MMLRILASALSPALTALLGFSPAPAPASAPAPAPAPVPASAPASDASDPADARVDEDEVEKSGEPEATNEGDEGDEGDEPDAPASAEQVVDVVLPCGVRVIAAKDASLPVAAVVLSIEVGTRDDPDKLPGLVHALAYHLQQGNRELAPGEGIATAHDAGGLAAMAVGPSQVRFESLIPISQLDAQLRVEALRLRAPNTGRELWLKSLSHARNDVGVKLVVPREAAAAAWNDPGLNHDGRVVGSGLSEMVGQALGAQLTRMFDYRNATLIVVGPEDSQALLERVEPLFADLPARARKPIAQATPPKPTTHAPQVVKLDRQNGDSMVWAVPGTPDARAWAQVLCGTLNRQKRGADENPKARVRCTYADDPRRPLLVLRAIGFDAPLGPEPMIAARLARIAAAETEPELAALIEDQRARIEADLVFALRAPLDLASYLASATDRDPSATDRNPSATGRDDGSSPALAVRPRDQILGLPRLPGPRPQAEAAAAVEPRDAAKPPAGDSKAGDATPVEPDPNAPVTPSASTLLAAAIPQLLDTRAAVLLLEPDQQTPPPVHAEPIAAPPATPGAQAEPEPEPEPEPATEAQEAS